MRPIRLKLINFRSHRDTTVEWTDGCWSIVGESGSGKSSLILALDVALFGPEGRSLAPYVSWGRDTMRIALTFEHRGRTYRVTRSVERGKSTVDLAVAGYDEADLRAGITLALEGIDPGEFRETTWNPLTAETGKATQERIEQILAFSRRTLRASSLLMQSDAGAFCEADPVDRKRVIGEAIGIERYATLAAAVRTDRQTVEREVATLAGQLAALGDLETAAMVVQDAESALAGAKAAHEAGTADLAEADGRAAELAAAYESLRGQAEDRRHTQGLHDQAETELRALERIDTEAQFARERADGERQQIVSLSALADEHALVVSKIDQSEEADRERTLMLAKAERLAEELAAVNAEKVALEVETNKLDGKITTATEQPDATCDRCRQALPDEARAELLLSLRGERDALLVRSTDLGVKAADLAERLAGIVVPDAVEGLAVLRARAVELADKSSQLAAHRARLSLLEETIALDTESHRASVNEHRAGLARLLDLLAGTPVVDPGQLAQAQTRATDQKASADRKRQHAQEAAVCVAMLTERVLTTQAALEKVTVVTSEHDDKTAHLRLLVEMEKGYGPNGVPLLILENRAIPAIETEANRVLAQLGGSVAGWHIELRTQTANANGSVRDALDIVVHTGPGYETEYLHVSGGEKTKVAIALRLGLARLLAHRSGADCQILAMDEPDGLDVQGKEALIQLVLSLGDTYRMVTFISHDADLRDRFDHVLAVELDTNGASSIQGAPAEVLA